MNVPLRRRKMSRMPSEPIEEDWHLREWMSHFGKKQADIAKELGWTKNRVHFVWHSTQPYRRGEVNAIATWLGIRPYELLMRPDDAMALRQLRRSAVQIAAESEHTPFEHAPAIPPPAKPRRTGTHG